MHVQGLPHGDRMLYQEDSLYDLPFGTRETYQEGALYSL